MLGLANVYTCFTCGDVTYVYLHEHIDCDNDEVYPVMHCGKCHGEVRQKTVEVDGQQIPVYGEVDDDFTAFLDDEGDY